MGKPPLTRELQDGAKECVKFLMTKIDKITVYLPESRSMLGTVAFIFRKPNEVNDTMLLFTGGIYS